MSEIDELLDSFDEPDRGPEPVTEPEPAQARPTPARRLAPQGPQVPQHDAAEWGLVGSCILDAKSIGVVLTVASEDDFGNAQAAMIFGATVRLWRDGKAPDLVLLTQDLQSSGDLDRAGGVEAIASAMESSTGGAQAKAYAQIVADTASRRRVFLEAQRLIAATQIPCREGASIVSRMAQSALEVASHGARVIETDVPRRVREVLDGILEEKIEEKAAPIPTGFYDLDRKLGGGMARGSLYVVAGRPSMGKSTLAVSIARHVTARGQRVGLVSVETRDQELIDNVLRATAKVQPEKRGAGLSEDEASRLLTAASELSSSGLWSIADGPRTCSDVGVVGRLWGARGVDLIVVDYLQLIEPDDPRLPRERQVAQISAAMKALAFHANAAVIAVSQLNRGVEQREDKRPRMSDLRDSGSIEQDADGVWLLYRPEYYREAHERAASPDPMAELIVAKNRRGATGSVELLFQAAWLRFDNAARVRGAPDGWGASPPPPPVLPPVFRDGIGL